MTTSTNRLLDAARRECAAREALAGISAKVERCEESDEGEPSTGDMGTPACRYIDDATPEDVATWCKPCQSYRANRDAFRAAKTEQRKARADMLRAYRAELIARAKPLGSRILTTESCDREVAERVAEDLAALWRDRNDSWPGTSHIIPLVLTALRERWKR